MPAAARERSSGYRQGRLRRPRPPLHPTSDDVSSQGSWLGSYRMAIGVDTPLRRAVAFGRGVVLSVVEDVGEVAFHIDDQRRRGTGWVPCHRPGQKLDGRAGRCGALEASRVEIDEPVLLDTLIA